ncbi:MAG: hypothetical protein IPH20_15885 [Bacteroidales bacterium]|nr:hypothetical protein [Bacteroidales bacterium]
MVVGSWQREKLAVGSWQLAVGSWQRKKLAVGKEKSWQLAKAVGKEKSWQLARQLAKKKVGSWQMAVGKDKSWQMTLWLMCILPSEAHFHNSKFSPATFDFRPEHAPALSA